MMAKKILITGTTSGIGYATAKQLYLQGHTLLMANRNPMKSMAVKNQMLSMPSRGKIELIDLDLASLASIQQCVETIINQHPDIDVIINNAGVFSRKEAYTKDGFELAYGVNYIGTFYLTETLLEHLGLRPIKIIMVSSLGSYLGKPDLTVESFKTFRHPFRNYFNSKLANLIHAQALAKRYRSTRVEVKAADPGIVYSQIWKWKSRLGQHFEKLRKKLMKSPDKGAESILRLIAIPSDLSPSGLLFNAKKAKALPKRLADQDFCEQFLKITEKAISSVRFQ